MPDIGYAETQNMLAAQQLEINRLKSQFGASQAAQGGFGDLTPIATWPTATRPAKNGRVTVTLRTAIPSSTNRLKIVLEQYEGSGSPVTVIDRIPSADIEVTDDQRVAGQGDFIFPVPLVFNAKYGCIKLVSIDINNNRVINPDPDFPESPRNESDYLITFTTAATSANAPSKPSLARLIRNTFEVTDDGLIPSVAFKVFADETELLTFSEQLTSQIQVKLQDVDDTAVTPRRVVNIEDASATFIVIEVGDLVVLGRNYSWLQNGAWNGDDFAVATPAASVTFFAGGFADPADLTNLTLVGFTSAATEDSTVLRITAELSQPTPPFRVKNYTAKRKKSGNVDSDFDLAKNLVVGRESLLDPIYNVAGSILIQFSMSVKPAAVYVVKITVRTIGGFTKDFTSGDITAAALTIPAQQSAASGGNSLVPGGALVASVKDYQDYRNTLDGSGAGAAGDADFPGENWQTGANSTVRINNRATGIGGSTLDSDGIRWMSADKRLLLATDIVTLGGTPAARLGKPFSPNASGIQQAVICPLFLSSSGTVTITFIVALVDQVSGDMDTVTMPLVITATEPARGFGILLVPTSYAGTAKQWLEFRPQSNPSANIYLWNAQLDTGVEFRHFKANAYEQSVLDFLDASANNAGSGSGNIVTEDDEGNLYSPDGTRGGQIFLPV